MICVNATMKLIGMNGWRLRRQKSPKDTDSQAPGDEVGKTGKPKNIRKTKIKKRQCRVSCN